MYMIAVMLIPPIVPPRVDITPNIMMRIKGKATSSEMYISAIKPKESRNLRISRVLIRINSLDSSLRNCVKSPPERIVAISPSINKVYLGEGDRSEAVFTAENMSFPRSFVSLKITLASSVEAGIVLVVLREMKSLSGELPALDRIDM